MITDPNMQKFFDIVDNAVALNIAHQLKFEDSKRFMASAHWMEEFGTVHINTGRATGKTRYIMTRMTPCDLVIVPMEQDVRSYYSDAGNVLDNVHSARSMFNRFNMAGYWRGRRDVPEYFNKVYVDEPGRMFNNKESHYQFYDWFGPRCNQIIMLGTAVR